MAQKLITFSHIDPLMRTLLIIAFFSVTLCASFSCKTSYQAQSLHYQEYRINTAQDKSSNLISIIKPYSDSVYKSMNDVVGIAEKALDKKNGESPLGNFMTDAYLTMAREKYKKPVDVAFMNPGGIRLTQLAAGSITRGKIFELMPFDNLLVLQRMTGDRLQQFADHVASRGGWPVAGLTMEVKDKKAVNVLVDGKPIDRTRTYTIANSDFVASGGDNSDLLRTLPQENMGYLVRDALFDYIKYLQKQGKPVTVSDQIRVINAQ